MTVTLQQEKEHTFRESEFVSAMQAFSSKLNKETLRALWCKLVETEQSRKVSSNDKKDLTVYMKLDSAVVWKYLPSIAEDKKSEVAEDVKSEPKAKRRKVVDGRVEFADEEDVIKCMRLHLLNRAMDNSPYLPMESPELSTSEVTSNRIESLKRLKMTDQINEALDSIKAQKTLVGQLANSLKTAASDLRSVVTKRRTDQEKKAKDENQKLQAEALAKQKDVETSEKKRLQKAKKVAPFKIDYQANGFAAIERFDSSEAFTKAPKPLGHKPFYVKNVESISALTSDASEKLKATVDRWLVSFPASSFAREKDCVKAPLEKPWGADRAMELIEQFLPQVVQSTMPAYASKVDTVNLYGYTPHHLACEMDTDLLGFIRAQTHGEAELVLMPGSHIMKLMRDMKLNVTKVAHRSFLMGLTTDAVNRAKQLELGIFTVKQESNSVLFVPAGWMILQRTCLTGIGCRLLPIVLAQVSRCLRCCSRGVQGRPRAEPEGTGEHMDPDIV